MDPAASTSVLSTPQVDVFRTRVREIFGQISHYYANANSALSISRFISEEMQKLICRLLDAAVERLPPEEQAELKKSSAVIAIGGTGRGDLAPYSDIDLLFLYHPRVEQIFQVVASDVIRNIWDCGLKLGHSVRTVSDALQMARTDPTFATSLIEFRRIWGDEDLSSKLQHQFRRQIIRRRLQEFLNDCLAARQQDFGPHGPTVTQLEPDIKRSPGGLRDLHLIRWIGLACFDSADWNRAPPASGITPDDIAALNAAHEFLSKLRIDMHLANGKRQDVLIREEQLRIAHEWNIQPKSGLRPVETLMQMYFRHSTAVSDIARRLLDSQRHRTWWKRIIDASCSHRVNGQFRIGLHEVNIEPRHKKRILGSVEEILRLYHTIGLYGIKPSRRLQVDIKQAVADMPREVSAEAAHQILSIFGLRSSLGMVLRSMYETGLLELCFPEMTHARCLLQFNQYHHYTVDEHTLRAVEEVTDFLQDKGPLGNAYRQIEEFTVLHLALFLHDLGKGYPEDHSEIGKQLAESVALRLGLPPSRREILVFLVHKHLLMTHLAFRRDIQDPEVLLRFSQAVGSPQVLRMLYVLSAADLKAVGPGVWNGWKGELLNDLFQSSVQLLSGDYARDNESQRLAEIRRQVQETCQQQKLFAGNEPLESSEPFDSQSWLKSRLETFPPQYLLSTEQDRIIADLQVLSELSSTGVDVSSHRDPETGVIEYRVITHENVAPGCFHKIAGALTANHLEILSAQITTTSDGFIIDRFLVLDHDYSGTVPGDRLRSVALTLRQTLLDQAALTAMFRRQQRFHNQLLLPLAGDAPVRVAIDNSSSNRCTVIDVFAHDKLGLLYTISRAIYDLELSVVLAKISTHLDQVVDVFYVTDRLNHKIIDESRLNAIRETLEQILTDFDRQGYRLFQRA
ncbi:MAG: [protein-PII] uridylyltransferase [Planctomycetaceae bacterium]